jgi:outer membrane biosynthesis protein TonB
MLEQRGLRRRAVSGLALSLLIHGLLVWTVVYEPKRPDSESRGERVPLVVELNQKAAKAAPEAAPAPSEPVALPPPDSVPAPVPAPKPARSVKPRTKPLTLPTPQAKVDQQEDFSAMVEAARRRREALGIAPSDIGTEPIRAQDANAKRDEIALQNIQRSVRPARGRESNGFLMLDKNPRIAHFSFQGAGESRVIEVDAGPNGDINRAIVRKMIAVIREHSPGDIDWVSRRLGRVERLSARRQDNAALEEFLMREFFGG